MKTAENTAPYIVLSDVVKSFPGVKALKGVSFDLYPGEVHALCGENGAGKSTLIKVMTGAHKMDSGSYLINGEPVSLRGPHDAIKMGVACVYQELFTAPQLSVAENLFMGMLPKKNGLVDYKTLYARSRDILKTLRLDVAPETPAGSLSIGKRQMLEIGRAIAAGSKVVIMDEPSSSLSEAETDTLFEIIQELTTHGTAIIYISHKLDEVMYLADRITVIRDGENIVTLDKAATNEDELIRYMIGREVESIYHKSAPHPGECALEVKSLTGRAGFSDISFSVRRGEVLGFFGLVGAGRSEIMRAVFGTDKFTGGEVILNGKRFTRMAPGLSVRNGLGFLTEDRKQDGLLLTLSVLTNMTIAKLPALSTAGFIRRKAQVQQSEEYKDALDIKTPSLFQLACNLSGGNQQKVILAKWLMTSPTVLIVDEPTRGIDVGSKSQIYELLDRLARHGMAIIVVSSEIEEIMGICDRVIAVCEGRITADLPVTEALSSETILSAALNVSGATGWRNPPPNKRITTEGGAEHDKA